MEHFSHVKVDYYILYIFDSTCWSSYVHQCFNSLKNICSMTRDLLSSVFDQKILPFNIPMAGLIDYFLFFRFGKHYELPLLIQSILMNITMFALIHLCVSIRRNDQILKGEDRIFTGKQMTNNKRQFRCILKR